jgi:hypothetical protein
MCVIAELCRSITEELFVAIIRRLIVVAPPAVGDLQDRALTYRSVICRCSVIRPSCVYLHFEKRDFR